MFRRAPIRVRRRKVEDLQHLYELGDHADLTFVTLAQDDGFELRVLRLEMDLHVRHNHAPAR